jgi:hypothetical protein
VGKVLVMTLLSYAEAVKDPAEFEKEGLRSRWTPRSWRWPRR